MAKKKKQSSGGSKDQTLCIKMVRNPRNNAYFFKEEVIPNDRVEDFFKQSEGQAQEQKQEEEASS
jgi:hypothetical protein